MAALAKPYETFERPGLVVAYKISNVKIYKGALLGVNASGFAVAMAHGTANLKFVGVANETVDNATGSAGDKQVAITKTGSFVFVPVAGFSPTVADLGKEAYANTDWEVQATSAGLTNAYKVGTIVAIESNSTGATGVRIRIDNYSV